MQQHGYHVAVVEPPCSAAIPADLGYLRGHMARLLMLQDFPEVLIVTSDTD